MGDLLTVDDLLALPEAPPDAVLPYGEAAEQVGHLYLPAAPPATAPGALWPLVILLHGGCWRARVNLSYFGGVARALSRDGVAVWSVEYRRLGNGGGWPQTFLDAAQGADFVRTLADDYALDPARVVTVGHSAGGHLALWLAARHKLNEDDALYRADPLGIRAAVSLAGIPDLAEAVRQGICQEAPADLMGGSPQARLERYRQGSPAQLLPLGVRQVLIQGEEDATVPLGYVEHYEAAARAQGDNVALLRLGHTGHFEIAMPTTPQWQTVREQILAAL